MKKTLPTPLIDAALAANLKAIRANTMFQLAKDTVLRALAEGKIFNVAFQDAKGDARNGVEVALNAVTDAFWEKHRDNYDMQKLDVSRYIQFNQVNARKRSLKKYAEVPEAKAYLAFLDEIALLRDAFDALKPMVVKGRKPSENPTPIDFTNTGTCAICMNRQKLEADKTMVHHGFKISNGGGNYFGFRSGSCFGCDYQPYELSNAGNIAFKVVLEDLRKKAAKTLRSLKAGEIKEFSNLVTKRVKGELVNELVTVREGDPLFPRELESAIGKTEWKISSLTHDINVQAELIKNWKLQPLPGEKGGK